MPPMRSTRDSILTNPLYANISGRFVQSHDYIAMERLHEIHTSGRYDLIVVDTPPTRNAIDFLEAPDRMAEFFSSRLLRWLTAPYQSRLFNVASKPLTSVADRILGSDFLADIAEFFVLFQTMHEGFVARAQGGHAHALATVARPSWWSPRSRPRRSPRPSSSSRRCSERDFHLGAVVLNKVLPAYLRSTAATKVARAVAADDPTVVDPVAAALDGEVADRAAVSRVLHDVAESFLNYQVVAKREGELRKELGAAAEVVATVPYFDSDIFDLSGLVELGEAIWQ